MLRTAIAVAAAVPALATAAPVGAAPAGKSAAPCRSVQLRLVRHGETGAAGTLLELLRLEPRRGVACSMKGFPGVSFLGRRGRRLPIPVGRERGSTNAVRTLTFSRSRPARFDVRHPSADPATTRACPASVYAIRVIPPNETRAIVLRLRHPARFCRSGARVIPVGRRY